ncbi:MAG: flavodoxin domain-containing protein [bacterium]
MPPVEIMKDVYWVGAVDWNIRDFHGYSTEKGTSYNSFLVMDDKITLFDTVKKPFRSELMHNIRRVVSPEKIDYIVVNHVEMDHSGSLPEVIAEVKPEKVFCSKKGKEALIEHFHNEDWPFRVVENGEELKLGKRTITFLETRMLHWPDSMFSYINEDGLLISSDAFGQHWATSERFDDEVDGPELLRHAAKYYANILLPYSSLVQKLLEEVNKLGIKINMIACDHGLIWRKNPEKIISAYDRWSRQEPANKAIIIYDTMWQSTETMAKAIADGILEEGVSYKMMNMSRTHRSDVVTELLDAKALVVGSPTLNNGIMPSVSDILTYMKGLRPRNKTGAAFGSYGWSGEAVKIINQELENMKIELLDQGVQVKYVPGHEALKPCVELGRKIGKAVRDEA